MVGLLLGSRLCVVQFSYYLLSEATELIEKLLVSRWQRLLNIVVDSFS